jgi:RHS repeat-associated protein
VKWDNSSLSWLPATSAPLAAHTPCWLFANQAATLSLTGSRKADDFIPLSPGPQFVVNPGVEPLDMATSFPTDSEILYFDRSVGRWRVRYSGSAALLSDAPDKLPPGASAFILCAQPGSVGIESPALEIRYYHPDHLGSANAVTDASGSLIEEAAFYSFGHQRNVHRPGLLFEPYGFAQQEKDTESSLSYFQARYYGSNLGRFLSVDPPLRTSTTPRPDPQLLHPYSYGVNRPLAMIDDSGLSPKEIGKFRQWAAKVQSRQWAAKVQSRISLMNEQSKLVDEAKSILKEWQGEIENAKGRLSESEGGASGIMAGEEQFVKSSLSQYANDKKLPGVGAALGPLIDTMKILDKYNQGKDVGDDVFWAVAKAVSGPFKTGVKAMQIVTDGLKKIANIDEATSRMDTMSEFYGSKLDEIQSQLKDLQFKQAEVERQLKESGNH